MDSEPVRRRIVLADHVRKRMMDRGITEAQIESAIIEPNVEMPGRKPGTRRVQKNIAKGKTLEVVYRPKPSKNLVITAWWRS